MQLVKSTILLGILLIILLSFAMPAAKISNAQTSTSLTASGASINVVSIVTPSFDVYSLNVPQRANATINLYSLNLASPEQIQLISSFRASDISAQAILDNGTAVTLKAAVISGTASAFIGYYLTLPASTNNVSATMSGSYNSEAFLFRLVAPIPFVLLEGINVPTSYSASLVTTSRTTLSQAYYSQGVLRPQYPSKIVGATANGYTTYELPSDIREVVLQSSSFRTESTAVSVIALVVVILASLGLAESGRKLLRSLTGKLRLPVIAKSSKRVFGSLPKSFRAYVSRLTTDPRSKFSSRTFLMLFVLCGILMVSIGVMAGPSPQIKAYVVAYPNSVPQIQNNLNLATGGSTQVVTPAQDYSDFNVMSSVGDFNIVVISAYPPLALPSVAGNLLPYLGNVPLIVVDNQANSTFVSQIESLYGHVVTVGNAANMNSTEIREISQEIHCCAQNRANLLGMGLSSSGFKEVIVVEAALSMIIVLLGGAFVGSVVSEANNDKTLFRFGSTVMAGCFAFLFAEIIYIVTSTLLTFPLSLHAVISGADTITGIGLLGKSIHLPFGGGTTPRLAAGATGVLLGALYSGWKTRFNLRVLLILVAIVVFLVANPLQIGTLTFQALLYFFANTPLGNFFTGSLTIKNYLYGIGFGLGGNISGSYLMSAGKMLFFAGLVPLAFLNKMGKNTASLAILLSAIMIGEGGVRIGEMTPSKTIIAVLPGLFAGFSFAFVLLLIAALEKYLSRSEVK
ncbi:MAG: hypothetical protein JRN52_00645 [Nitrososphaerota archaeon]|nr:hypothetical protein [Nitrososphaerota archaeon]